MDDKQLEELMVQSFIKIMMETEKSAEGKAELAQAQAKAEQRNNPDVHLKFSNEGLYITTDDAGNIAQSARQHLTSQLLPAPLQHQTPQHENEYDHYDGGDDRMEETVYPMFSSYLRGNEHKGSLSNSNNTLVYADNKINNVTHTSEPQIWNLHEDLIHADNNNKRRRRLGRDHTNYILLPSLNSFTDKNAKYENSPGQSLTDDGPPGLPLGGDENNYGEEARLKLVVVDKTDDEDMSAGPDSYHVPENSKLFESWYAPHSKSDVFPIDKSAVDRDLYKQMYDPTAETVKMNKSNSIHTSHGRTSVDNTFVFRENAHKASSLNQSDNNYNDPSDNNPGFTFQTTDYDSITTIGSRKTSLGPGLKYNSVQQYHFAIKAIPHEQIPAVYRHHNSENSRASFISQPMYALSQVDYERYSSDPSQLKSVREDEKRIIRGTSVVSKRPGIMYKELNSRSLYHFPESSIQLPSDDRYKEPKVQGPGYKFQVNKYNVAKRASILNRAEKLLDARRGQLIDRSDSSEELQRIDEDDNEDSDSIDEVEGPRHRALKHIQRSMYDESISYNSSDDVLHNMKLKRKQKLSKGITLMSI